MNIKSSYSKNYSNKFSIICATYKNSFSILSLIKSLKNQQYKNFELVICDQNKNNTIKKIIYPYKNIIKIHHLKTSIGLSKSRNKGLEKITGSYVLFLDDDIIVPRKFFLNLSKIINQQIKKNNTIICFKILNEIGKTLLKYPKSNYIIKKESEIFKYISSVSFVVKYNKFIKFNNNLGLGSKSIFQSGEETELLINLFKKKYKIFFDNSLYLIHQTKKRNYNFILYKHFFYGCGWGYLVKKKYNKIIFLISQLIKVFINILYYFFTLNFKNSSKSLMTLLGRIFGYIKA